MFMNLTLKQRVLTPEEEHQNTKAIVAHVVPFIVWLTMMVWFDNPEWSYNLRTFGGIIILLIFRPWKWYPKFNLKNLPISIAVGIFIFFIWIGFESIWMKTTFPYITEWYERIFVNLTSFQSRDLYASNIYHESFVPFEVIDTGIYSGFHVYDPNVTGWINFSIHMIGTSIVIAIIEEFFYRSFVYRWMQGSPFLEINPSRLIWPLLIIISVFFSVSHIEWGAAIICGILFGLLYIKTNDIWSAVIAHGTTNFLLGLYVVKFDAYQFW